MLSWLLRKMGYLYVDYGCSCGRHWIEIDGKTMCQSSGDDIPMFDEEVQRIGAALGFWKPPEDFGFEIRRVAKRTAETVSANGEKE